MAKERVITAIDIGSTRIRVVVGLVGGEDARVPQVIGVGDAPSHGIRKGQIIDIEETINSIAQAVSEAERMAGSPVDHAIVNLGGVGMGMITSRGFISIGRQDGEIHTEDIQRVLEAAQAVSIPQTQKVVKIIPRAFTVDDQVGIKDPVGMTGVRLEVDAMIMTAPQAAMRNIVEVRKNGGPFTSLQNFLERIDPTMLNRKSLEALIKANAFADIAKADVLMNNLDQLVNYLGTLRKLRDTPADSLFADMLELNAPAFFVLKEPEQTLSARDILKWEKEALGLYLSGHPLDYLKPLLAEEIPRLDKITPSFEGKKVKISGMIMQAKRIITKSGSAMCFIELENSFGKIEGIIFAKAMPACQEECKEENVVTAAGTISFRDNRSGQQGDTPKFLIDSLVPFVLPAPKSDGQKQAAKPYTIPVPANITSTQLNALKNILTAHPGTHPVELELTSPLQKSTIIHLPDRIEPSATFQESLTAFHATFTQ